MSITPQSIIWWEAENVVEPEIWGVDAQRNCRYWRVEPSTQFYCDMTYDPFTFMRENNKKYSFVIALPEYRETIETLWSTTQEFAKLHPEYIAKNNSLGFISDDDASKG